MDEYNVKKEITDDEKILKKRTSMDVKSKIKHLLERWILIETEHLRFT